MVDFIIFGIFLIVFLIIISYGHDLNEDIWCCFDPCSQPYLMEKDFFCCCISMQRTFGLRSDCYISSLESIEPQINNHRPKMH